MLSDAGTFNRNSELIGRIVAAEDRTDHERLADLFALANETEDAQLMEILTDASDSSNSKLLRVARLVQAEPEAPLTREG